MTCREVFGFLMAYQAGELPAPQVLEFDRHLAVCPPCVAYLASYEQTRLLCESLREDDAAAEIPAELVDAILIAKERGTPSS